MRVMLAQPGPAGDVASREVSRRVVTVLQGTHGDVALIPTTNQQEALAEARAANAAYLVSPVIEEWSDGHAPPFTADHVKVRLDLLDPNGGEVVGSVTFSNVSSLFAVTDSSPEVLLDKTFDRAVLALVQDGASAKVLGGYVVGG